MSEYPVGVGFRFQPTVQELLHLLELKIRGYQLPPPACMVAEAPLYGKNATPWEVLSEEELWQPCDVNAINNTKQQMYVFTKLSRASAQKVSRTAGIGTWDGQTNRKPILDYNEEKTIGSVKFLNYSVNPDCASLAKGKGYWNMHEYSLDGYSLAGIGHTDWVICRITRDDSKDSKLNKVRQVKEVVAKDKDQSVQELMGYQNHNNSQFLPFKGDDVLNDQYGQRIIASENPFTQQSQEAERQEFGYQVVSLEGGHQHEALVTIPQENSTCGIGNVEGFFDQSIWENNPIDYGSERMECQGVNGNRDYSDGTATTPIELDCAGKQVDGVEEENVAQSVGSCGSNVVGVEHQELENHDADPSEFLTAVTGEDVSFLAPGFLQMLQGDDNHSQLIPMYSDESGSQVVSLERGHQHGALVTIPQQNPTCGIGNVGGFFDQCNWEKNPIDCGSGRMDCQEVNRNRDYSDGTSAAPIELDCDGKQVVGVEQENVARCGSNVVGVDHQELENYDVDPSELLTSLLGEVESFLAPGYWQMMQEDDNHSQLIPMYSNEWFAMMAKEGESCNPLLAEI